MHECFIGVDLGTGSAKGTAVDITGRILSTASIPHEMSSPQPGWFEQDADGIWWNETAALCRKLVSDLKDQGIDSSYIKALSVSTTAPCVLPVDEKGTPLRAGIMYGIDTRASAQINQIERAVGKENIFSKTAQHLSSQSATPKILWIRDQEPRVWDRTKKVLTASGYLVFKLTGRYTVDTYDAIAYAPLFNIRTRQWERTYESDLFSLDLLPDILWTTEVAGTITRQAAETTTLPEGIPVLTGTADAAAEAVSVGVRAPGDMMMMYGSSNFFIMQTSELKPIPQFWASNFLTAGTTVVTGGMATVGSLFSWFNQTFPGRSFSQWEELARESKPGANGITILPYFAGERTPLFDAHAKGVFFGMQLTTTAGDMYQALQEAIGYGIRHNLETLREAGEQAGRIIAIGGVSSSAMSMQIISDAAGCVQQIPSQTAGASYGDAFLAAYGSGWIDSLQDINSWVSIVKAYEPNPKHASVYEQGYQRYRELYETTKHLMR
jgi:xylulokinase